MGKEGIKKIITKGLKLVSGSPESFLQPQRQRPSRDHPSSWPWDGTSGCTNHTTKLETSAFGWAQKWSNSIKTTFIVMATMRTKLAFCRPRFYGNSHIPEVISCYHYHPFTGTICSDHLGVSLPPDHPVFPTAPHHNWRIPEDFIKLLPSLKHLQMPCQQSPDLKKNIQDPLSIPAPARKLK